MELTGYILCVFIGIALGMIGGGGSVLTIPILVYFFGIEPILATSYSLFIVGTTSLAGVYQKWERKEINLHVAIAFGIPSLLTVFAIRKLVIPFIPELIFNLNGNIITKGKLTLILFSVLMISAAVGMLKPQRIERPVLPEAQGLALLGFFVGIISGLLGAGGGFIIIPALVFYASLDMKSAVGTSLMIITFNSMIGFIGDIGHHPIEWTKLIVITLLGIAGTYIGNRISSHMSAVRMKTIFGGFILTIGLFILLKELFFT